MTVGFLLNVDLEKVSSPSDTLSRSVKHTPIMYVPISGHSSMKIARSLLSSILRHIFIFIEIRNVF